MNRVNVALDWDGTVTAIDALHVVLEEFGDEDIFEAHEARLGRELTLHEVIAGEFRTVRTPVEEVASWLCENAELRAGFAEFARAYRPRIVSSGFHELIEPLLAREGLDLEVIANRLDARADGWRVLFRNHEPCPVCGEPCKRVDLVDLDDFVFVGDGYSDRCVSLAAGRVFARDGLADYLARQGVAFEPFTDFYALAESLDAGGAVVRPA